MTKSRLKSSTAFSVIIALAAPAPLVAQTDDAAFPCIAPSGAEVSSMAELAQDVASLAQSGAAPSADMTCSQPVAETVTTEEAAPEETAVPEEEPAATAEAAPEETVIPQEEPAATAEAAPEDTAVPEEEPAATAEATPEETVVPEEEPAATAEATPEDTAVPEEEPAATAEAAPEETVVPEEEPAATADATPEDTAVPEEEPAATAEAAPEDAVVPEDEPAPTAEAAPEDTTTSTEEPAATAEAAPEDTVAPEGEAAPAAEPETESAVELATDAEAAPEVPAGEAGGLALTDAERQELDQARQDTATASAAAATETDEEAATDAEVTTETITADDVRTSDQDFENAVTAQQEIDEDDDNGGLSNFEKALLLGLGAAVVGSVLSNGDEVVSNTGDRVIIERDGELRVLKNDDELLQRPGAQVETQTFQDGSTRTTVTYEDGSQTRTVRASDGTVLRRTRIRASDGAEIVLFDDTQTAPTIDFATLPTVDQLNAQQVVQVDDTEAALASRLKAPLLAGVDRQFSLGQVRQFKQVRALAPQVEVTAVTFATGSSAIEPEQARALSGLGAAINDIIAENPQAVFLVEGHTDATGSASSNLALSDRRAETVALALAEFFQVPPENLITQGYGESDLKVNVLTNEPQNRRAVVRNISGLLN